jgi:intracellular septation protein A
LDVPARILKILKFLWENFGPIFVFQIAYRLGGLTIGTSLAMVTAVAECAWILHKGEKPTLLLMLTTALCLGFGAIDIYFQSSTFMIYEAPIINLFIAAVFALSMRKEVSIIQELAEKKKDMSSRPFRDRQFFFRGFTLIWVLYFLVRAAGFLWLNRHGNIDTIWARLLIGKLTMMAMIGLSVMGGRPLWQLTHRLGLFPSQRNAEIVPAKLGS